MFICNPDAPYWTTGLRVERWEEQKASLLPSDVTLIATQQEHISGCSTDLLYQGNTTKLSLIADVTPGDFGTYTCMVSNTIDSQTHQSEFPITLVPRGGPDPPSALEVAHITSVSADIHWTAGFDGGYQDAWFEVAYKLAPESDFGVWEKVDVVPVGQTVTHRISSLSEQSDYLVRVKSVNSHDGRSDSSPIETIFTTKCKLYNIAIG